MQNSRPRKPTLAEYRAVAHPPGLKERRSGEHWAGRLYMRDVSSRISRHLVNGRLTPNHYTWIMTVAGLLSGPALLVPGIAGAVLGAVMMQLYLLLDCMDGELARWRNQKSVVGVYLDRVGAYLADASLLAGFGLRCAGVGQGHGATEPWWAVLGVGAALCAILIKSETDLVHVARAAAGMPVIGESASVPRSGGVALARRLASGLQFHRLIGGIEASLVIVVVAVVDLFVGGGLTVQRVLVVVVCAIAVLQTALHLASIMFSSRLR
nr:CDP-alcohol phosphatidyltransferase family protein [Mangrovactinospora gilvigrisea]